MDLNENEINKALQKIWDSGKELPIPFRRIIKLGGGFTSKNEDGLYYQKQLDGEYKFLYEIKDGKKL